MRIRWLVPFAWCHSALVLGALASPKRVLDPLLGGDPAQALVVLACIALALCGMRAAIAVHLTAAFRILAACGAPMPRLAATARAIAPLALRAAVAASAGAVAAAPVVTANAHAQTAEAAQPPSPDSGLWPISAEGTGPIGDSAHGDSPIGDSPRGRAPIGDSPTGDSPHGGADAHVVAPGETLWEIAASGCEDCGPAEIADRVAEIHRANAEVIGGDVDLILPGQRVVLP